MEKVIKEKCLCGDGKSSIFDSRKNKWVKSNIDCNICGGNGYNKYVLYDSQLSIVFYGKWKLTNEKTSII